MFKKTNSGLKIICLNRKASFNFFFENLIEAGIVLKGSEIKSVREGRVNIADSYAVEKKGEIVLINSHIATYKQASYSNHKPHDERKLLLNKKEINKLIGKMQREGFTIIPTKMYFKKGKAKIELAIAKGKKQFDKRASKRKKIGIVIKQDILEKQVNTVYLGIGSNLGNRSVNIEKAKIRLFENNIKIIKSSSFYETLSWPNPNNPKFYNIVLKTKTNLNVNELLQICKKIEKSLGRKKSPKNSPRECDIDILDYAKKSQNDKVCLPHPMLHKRNFVLIPLFEIEKNWIHPRSKHHIKKLIFSLSNSDISSIKKV